MVGWHHGLSGHESEQTLGDGEVQGSMAYCSSWGCRVGHDLTTEQWGHLPIKWSSRGESLR